MKNNFLKSLGSVVIAGIFILMAFGSDESKEERKINNFVLNGNSISFTFEVDFMYTLAYCGLAKDIWWVLHKNQNVTNLDIKIIEECEDKFGNKDKKETILHLDQEWIENYEVRKYNDQDKFCSYADKNSIFIDQWVPRGNNCY